MERVTVERGRTLHGVIARLAVVPALFAAALLLSGAVAVGSPTSTAQSTTVTGTVTSPTDTSHAGHAHGRARLPASCRPKAQIVLTGQVVASSPASLAVRVTRATGTGRAYLGRVVSIVVHTRTVFTRGRAPAFTADAGDRVTAHVGRCKAKGRTLIATRVVVQPPAPPA